MADRTCPRCGAAVSARLKFCRDCGGRLEEAPEAAPPPAAGGGDETILSGMAAVRPAPPAPPAPMELEEEEEPEDPGDKTLMSGLDRSRLPGGGAAGGPAPGRDYPPPPREEGPEESPSTATFVGTVPPGMAAPVAPPPPPLPEPSPPEREEEPVTDDFDLGDGADSDDASGATLMAPPPALRTPPPPPPAPPPRGAEFKLEHWSPRVKGSEVRIPGEEAVVGRDKGDIQYPDDNYLSRKHGRFHRDGEGRLCVEDLGTLNGTFLRVRVPLKLEHRDVLAIGRHVFRFEVLKFEEKDDRTIEGDPLTRVQGVQGTAPRARLVKRQEEGFCGIPFFFGSHRYVLGRTDGSHRFTRDDQMSRRHAALAFSEGDYWLEDLGSQNGTWLRLRGVHVLQAGDVIRMGEQYFKYA